MNTNLGSEARDKHSQNTRSECNPHRRLHQSRVSLADYTSRGSEELSQHCDTSFQKWRTVKRTCDNQYALHVLNRRRARSNSRNQRDGSLVERFVLEVVICGGSMSYLAGGK